MIIWQFVDGKPGHEKQSLGLLEAFANITETKVYSIDISHKGLFWRKIIQHLMGSKFHLPTPTLLVGAGHATHLPIIASKALFGGKSIVLMQPSLPLSLFDIVVVPQHDRYRPAANLVTSVGALGSTQSQPKKADTGLILLGGINRHFLWQDNVVLEQIHRIITNAAHISWTICDSRRTPEFTREKLSGQNGYDYKPWEETTSQYLTEALAKTEFVWVTADSVSMLYEALSSHASVGIILLDEAKPGTSNKLLKGINMLLDDDRITLSSDSLSLNPKPKDAVRLDENKRIAQFIAEKLNIK